MQAITEATKEAASIANQYGVSIEELTALITIAESRTKQGGNVVGNAIKSILLQTQDITNNQVVKAFDSVGISMYKIVDGAKLLKTPIELLKELAEVFNSLPQGDDRKATVLSDIGGKYRANTLAAILQDWDSMQGIMETYASGAGSAMREAIKTTNSLAGTLQQLKNSGQEFFSKFFDTDKVTGFLKAFTQLVQLATDLVDTLGAIPTILGTIGATALLKNGGMFVELGSAMKSVSDVVNNSVWETGSEKYIQALANSTKSLTAQQQAYVLSTNGVSAANIRAAMSTNDVIESDINAALAKVGLTNATKQLTAQQVREILMTQTNDAEKTKSIMIEMGLVSAREDEIVATTQLSYAQLNATLTQRGLTQEQIRAIAVQLGYTTGVKAATTGLSMFGTAIKGAIAQLLIMLKNIRAFINLHPVITSIVAVLSVAIAAWKSYQKTQEEIKEATEKAIEQQKERHESLEQEVETVRTIVKEYDELGKKTELTADEKDKLAELQKKLNNLYNTEAKGIDLVNGKYDEQIEKLNTLNAAKENELYQSTHQSRLSAQRAFEGTDIDEIFDKEISKALKRDFGGGDFYNRFISAVLEKGFEGIDYTVYGEDSGDLSLSNSLNAKQKIEALKTIKTTLNRVATGAEQNTDSFVLLNNRLDTLINDYSEKATEYSNLLNEEVEYLVNNFEHNGTTIKNAWGALGLAWRDAMEEEFAKDDPQLRSAIDRYYFDIIIPSFQENNDELADKVSFNWAEFYDEQGLEDIEKKLKSLKTAYKSLEEDGTLSKDEEASLLKEYPELLQYIDDPDRLKVAIQSSARDTLSAAQLVLSNLYLSAKAGSIEEQNLRNALQILEDMADVTTKVKKEKEKATKVSDLYKDQKLQIHENITALEREVKTIDKQISALEKKKDLQEKYIKTLEKEKDRLEDLIDDYETAASTVKDFIDEQNDALEKQKDNIEDTYEAQIKAIEETYDKQVKLLEAQEEGFDKQIKALQDEANEQDRLNDLKEKELALEKAKNEKVRVYDESRGWIITENSEEVSKKRKELEEAQRENKIAELEKEKERLESEKERLQAEKEQRTSELESIRDKEIEALQAEMDKLKEYKKAWEEAIAAYKKAQDEMTTAAILGTDWRTKLAEQDKTIIEDYKNGYEGVQNQLNNSVIPMIELANKELDTYSEQIDKLKEQKDLYKDMEDNQKKYLDFYKTYAEQFADATKEQSDAVEALNKALATNTLLTNMDNTDKAWDWAKSLFDEDYIREYPDYKGGKTASSSGLIGRLTDIFNKSTSVYDSFVKSIPNLLNKASSDLSGQVIAGAKLIADSVTNNKSNTDNRTQTINVNNPGFAMTEAAFMTMLGTAFAKMDSEAQIGKK